MLHRTLSLLAILILTASSAPAWTGKVVDLSDARTLSVERSGRELSVHLYGISCPEPAEPYGQEALDFASSLVLDKQVRVTVHRELSGRLLVEIFPPETDSSLNALLLQEGLGWVHEAYCEKADLCGRWESIQGQASSAGRGIWAEVPENMPAWRWLKEDGME